MSVISLAGITTLLFSEKNLERILTTLIAFSAGSLMGGAFFHLLPTALEQIPDPMTSLTWMIGGFTLFFALEQFMHWHHHNGWLSTTKQPVTYLILVADGLHNLLGGLAVASAFLIDIHLGMTTLLAAAVHEIPEELGDFAILVKGGWEKLPALAVNFLSSLTFLGAGLAVYFVSSDIDLRYIIPFSAGNFLYIAASDLVPQVNKWNSYRKNGLQFTAFLAGLALLLLITDHGH